MKKKYILLYALLLLTCFSPALLTMVSGREMVDETLRAYGEIIEAPVEFTNLSRLFNLIVFLLVAAMIFSAKPSLRLSQKYVMIGISVYFVTSYLMGSIFGTYTGMNDIYAIISFLVIIVAVRCNFLTKHRLLTWCRNILAIMVLASLMSAYIAPHWAYSSDGQDGRRLIGLYNHPRALGLSSLFLLLIELLEPIQKTILRYAYKIIAIWVIFLSMSKTSIILVLLVIGFWLIKFWKTSGKSSYFLPFFVFSGFLTGIYFFASFSFDYFEKNVNMVSSLTGRDYIWGYTLSEWLKNPLFGNGPAFFGHGGHFFQFSHAHNIFIQSISDGGIFGLLGLVFYLYFLVKCAILNSARREYLPIGMIVVLFVFSMTEPVIRLSGIYSGEFFILLFSLIYISAPTSKKNNFKVMY